MKKNIFDLLMEIKAEVIKSLKPSGPKIIFSEEQANLSPEMPLVDDV